MVQFSKHGACIGCVPAAARRLGWGKREKVAASRVDQLKGSTLVVPGSLQEDDRS